MTRIEIATGFAMLVLLVGIAWLAGRDDVPAGTGDASPALQVTAPRAELVGSASDQLPARPEQPLPFTVESIAGGPGARSVATIRLANGEQMTVSEGTTIGDGLVIESVSAWGVNARVGNDRLRVTK